MDDAYPARLERLLNLNEGTRPAQVRVYAASGTSTESQRGFVLRALREHNGNISRTAESIGMVRQSLQQKIRELGLRDEDWTNGE